MRDRYASFANSGPGRTVVRRLGLPDPPRLRRHAAGEPLTPGPILLGSAPGGRLADPVRKLFDVTDSGAEDTRYGALIFDATGVTESAGLRALYDFFHPRAHSLLASGRVVVLGTPSQGCGSPREATAQRALEGLVRSIGKEFGRGITAQLVLVAPGGETAIESTLRFLLSGRSAYVSGQVIRVGAGTVTAPADWERPLDGRTALVTGAARGIGAAI
ncbi:short chain dehydrogenase, partial [Actinoplanes sp. NPDC026623]